MRNTMLVLVFVLSAFMAGEAMSRGAPWPRTTQPEPAPVEVPAEQPSVEVPYEAKKVILEYKLQGFNAAQLARMKKIFVITEDIVNSEEFKKKVYGQYYRGKKGFVDNNGDTNEVVYQRFMEGKELTSAIDHVWNMPIILEWGSRGVLGWTYPNVYEIWFNSRNFDGRDDAGLSGTICHEYGHKLGYDHAYRHNAARPSSVPYAVGTICALLYPEFLKKK